MTRAVWPKLVLLGCLIPIFLAACNNVGEDFHLRPDETYDGGQHLVVLDVEIEAGSEVRGDLGITAADDVQINGHIDGDLTVVAANLTVGPEAEINGDLVYCLVRDADPRINDEAIIWGEVSDSCRDASAALSLTSSNEEANYFLRFVGTVTLSLLAGLVAAFSTIFFPGHLSTIRRTAYRQRLSSFGMGVLTFMVALGLFMLWRFSLAIVVPIVLAPMVIGAFFLLIVLTGAGVISVAQPLGRWLLRRLRFGEQIPLVTTTVGTATLVFIMLSFRIVPSLGFITVLILAVCLSWGLGASLLTRAGTR